MGASTYVVLGTVTATSGGASSFTFNNIPQTFTDLQVKASLRTNRTVAVWDDIKVTFNSNTSNYRFRFMQQNATSVGSSDENISDAIWTLNGNGASSNCFGNGEIYIPNYTGGESKSWWGRSDSTNNTTTEAYIMYWVNRWNNLSPITSLSLAPVNGTSFVQYSSATLYGIRNS